MVAAALVAGLAACAPEGETGGDVTLETDDQVASYGIGYNVGGGLVPLGDSIDVKAFAMGLQDALSEAEPAVAQDTLQQVLQRFQMELQQAQQVVMAEKAEANQAVADSFLAVVAEREGVQTTESGLMYQVVEPGDGPMPGAEDQVTVHYRGTLPDGTQFDSSYDRDAPATFSLQGVIPGFAEGLQLMPVGSTYRLFIPPELGYGPRGTGPIPPNSALVFEIEMLEIVE